MFVISRLLVVILALGAGMASILTAAPSRQSTSEQARAVQSTLPVGVVWTPYTAGGPPARTAAAMVWDSVRQVIVLYGGTDTSARNDTWEFGSTGWRQIQPAHNPGVASGHSMAYDPVRERVVFYYGTLTKPTWEYDGQDWSEISTAHRPEARSSVAMEFFPPLGRIVLFGGFGSSQPVHETWSYDGVDWSRIETPTSPPSLAWMGMVYDASRQVLVIHGSTSSDAYGVRETWEFDGATWHKVETAHLPPRGNTQALAFDRRLGVTLLATGGTYRNWHNQTWVYDGADWTELAVLGTGNKPVARYQARMIYDSVGDRMVLYGGFNDSHLGDTWMATLVGEATPTPTPTWTPTPTPTPTGTLTPPPTPPPLPVGVVWTRFESGGPPARTDAGMTYDSDRHVIVLNGGTSTTGKNDTWEFDDTGWHEIHPAHNPGVAAGHRLAYDPSRRRVVYFYGTFASPTWEYDGSDWTAVNTAHRPAAETSVAMEFFPPLGRIVLFGGFGSSQPVNETWSYDGADWSRIETSASPPSLAWAGMVYDASRHVLVLHGCTSTDLYGIRETWEFDGTTWHQVVTVHKPPFGDTRALAFDQRRGVTMLATGGTYQNWHNQTWIYDGLDWTQLPELQTGQKPSARYEARMVYDPVGDRMVLYGGFNNVHQGDTWIASLIEEVAPTPTPTGSYTPLPTPTPGGVWYEERDFAGTGLVRYYPFDTGAQDKSGSGAAGTPVNVDVAAGHSGECYAFRGITGQANSSRIEIPDIPHSDAVTLAAWVNLNQYSPFTTYAQSSFIFHRRAHYNDLSLYVEVDGTIGFDLLRGSYVPNNEVHSDATVSLHDWHHVCATMDSQYTRAYLDGIMVAEAPSAGSLVWNGSYYTSTIGLHRDGIVSWWQPFDGRIDDVMVFDRALVAKEVTALASDADGNGVPDYFDAAATPTPTPTPSPTPVLPENVQVFVLDDYGAVHTGGAANAVALTGGAYFGWNIARALQIVYGLPTSNAAHMGCMVLDGYGALHTLSSLRPAQNFYFNSDVACDLAVCQENLSGVPGNIGVFVLDRTGGLWACGQADPAVAAAASFAPPVDGVVVHAVDVELADRTGRSGWIMDNFGGVHPFGGAPAPNFPISTQSNWIRLAKVDDQLLRMDASGVLSWSGTPPAGWELPMIDADLMVDVAVEKSHGLVALDRFGALYPTAGAVLPPAGSGPPYFGFEVARDLEIGPPFGR